MLEESLTREAALQDAVVADIKSKAWLFKIVLKRLHTDVKIRGLCYIYIDKEHSMNIRKRGLNSDEHFPSILSKMHEIPHVFSLFSVPF